MTAPPVTSIPESGGILDQGNIDLSHRPRVRNPDASGDIVLPSNENEYDALIRGERPHRADEPNEYDAIAKTLGESDVQSLKSSVYLGSKQNPDSTARALALQAKTGLPSDLILRNLDTVEKGVAAAQLNPDHFRKTSPTVAKWVSEHPDHAAVARDDFARLSYLERQVKYIESQFHAGRSTTELQEIGERAMLGTATAADRKRQAELEASLAEQENFGITGFFEEIPGAISNQLPIFAQTFLGKAQGATFGAAHGAAAGAIIGSPGGVPGAAAGAAAGSAVGAALGWRYGAAVQAARMEGALAYLEFEKATDSDGRPLDRRIALGAAAITGVVNGALETLGFESIVKAVPGLRSLGRAELKRALMSQTMRGAVTRYARSIGEAMLTEGATEFMQDVVKNAAGEFARMIQDGSVKTLSSGAILGRIFSEEHMREAIADARAGAQAGGGTAAGAGAFSLSTDLTRAKTARRTAEAFTALGETVKDSKLQARIPAKMQEVVDRLTKDGPVETVYAPAETWNTYWQSKGLDPAAVAEEVAGSRESYDEAQRTGGDIAIPTARYATLLAPTEHNAFLATELRAGPGEMNAREASELVQRLDAEESVQSEPPVITSAQKVAENVAAQLSSAGFDEHTAETYAKVYSAAFGTLAAREGMDPQTLFDRYGITVERPTQQTVAPTELQPRIDLAQVATRAQAFRESQTERAALQAEEAPATPYDVPVAERKSGDKTSDNLFVYARTASGAIRSNLGKVHTDGLIDELALLLEANNKDSEQAVPTVNEDEGMHASSLGRPYVGFKGGAVNALGRITQRKKSIQRIESELARRGVDDVNERVWRRFTGQSETDATDFSFQQSLRDLDAEHAAARQRYEETVRQIHNLPTERRQALLSALKAPPDILHLKQDARGNIKIGPHGIKIELLADADLSTFIHETGHLYVEVIRDLASQPDASESIKRDYAILREWVGAEEGKGFSREQHEQIARGFEAYLMEGKAPSVELRGAFARFRAWLVGLYRSLESLQVLLTPEVRGVFDRLLASEEQIEAAEREQNMEPLFADPAAVGMSAKQATEYRDAVEEARRAAEDEIAGRLIAEVQREQSAVYKAERLKVRAQVAEEVNQERDTVALSLLSRGTLPDGSPLPLGLEPFKLSKQGLLDDFTERYPNLLYRLRRFFLYSKEGGVHPDQAADLLGYTSGDELIQAMLAAEESPAKRIDRLTDERMKSEDPNLISEAELPIEAMKAVHNEKRAEVLRKELQHLASNNLSTLKGLVRKITRRVPPLAEVRDEAQRIIAAKRVREINPLLYQRAEQRSAKRAVDALLKGDFELAFDEKQRELLNHELYRAATKARDEVDRVVDYMRGLGKASARERLGKAGGDYLAQIDGLRDRFSFSSSVSLRELDRRKVLREFVEEQRKQGFEPPIPDWRLEEAYVTHYKDMTLDEVRGVFQSVQWIEHLANLKNSLLASKRSREMDQARTEMIASIGASHSLKGNPDELAPTRVQSLANKVVRGIAQHTRMEFLFDFLDGYKGNGPVWEYLFKPFADAENAENEMRRQDAEAFKRIFSAYSRRERASWTKRQFIEAAKTDKTTGNLTKANILSVALNWGNVYNRDALMRGYGWTPTQVEQILATLDERDWNTVQAIWDYIGSYWPQVEQMEKDINGVAPQRVEASPVTTKFGEMRGGYYPIIFNRELSTRQAALDEKATVQEMFGGNWARAMTRHGHTIERTDTGGKPLRLELSGLTDHLGAVVHDLAYRRAVIDAWRLIHDEHIAEAIEIAAGRDMYRQLNPWLGAIAGDRVREFATETEQLLSRARTGATVVGLGLKVTSAVMQTLGYTLTVKELGLKYGLAGLSDAYRNPRRIKANWQFITERSQMMRDRLTSYDRDVRDYARKPDLIPHDAAWFVFVGYLDLATSIPSWLGAYRKAMDGALEGVAKGNEQAAIDYADKVVRVTQAAGGAKDLATVQRGSELRRLFTMFYSSMSILFNQFDKTRREYVLEKNLPKLLAGLTLVWFAPAILESMIRGQGPDDDDDESWAWWILKKEIAYPFTTVVIVRDLASGLENALTKGRKDYSGSPVFEAVESGYGAAIALKRAVTGDEVTRGNLRDLVQTVGYFAKLPTSQLWKTGEYFHDWLTGEEEPANLGEGLYRGLVTGKAR